MARSNKSKSAQVAWDRIEALAGHGVWESDLVVVSLANTEIEDDDLALFRDFPYVQILDLSQTKITDKGLEHFGGLRALEELILTGTKISKKAIEVFVRDHPGVKVTTKPTRKGTTNPFTGEPS